VITRIWTERVNGFITRVLWESDATPPVTYWIYVDGIFLGTQTADFIDIVERTVPTRVAVFDTEDHPAPAPGIDGALTLRWLDVANAVAYRVERDIGEGFEAVGHLNDDGSRDGWEFRLTGLPDETVVTARVYAIDAAGEELLAAETSAMVVRVPDVPLVSLAVAAGDLTVSEA